MAAGSSQSLLHQFSSQLSLFPLSLVCLGSGYSGVRFIMHMSEDNKVENSNDEGPERNN